jgi:hypothetical protein
MSARSLVPALALVLLTSPSIAAPAAPRDLPVVLRCEACTSEDRPSLGVLWRGSHGEEPPMGSVETLDWSAGRFTWKAPGAEPVALTAQRSEDGAGWVVSIPAGSEAPFRLIAALQGFAADRSAWWPQREQGPFVVTLRPVADVLDANPAWDPQRTAECDVLVPKTAEMPVTFFVQGQPRAWLYPAEAAADGTPQWTFQFVKPGMGLLDRVNTVVPGFDEADSWAFRLPLQSLLGGGAAWPAPGAEPASGTPADEIRVSGAGTVRLQDCPRATR